MILRLGLLGILGIVSRQNSIRTEIGVMSFLERSKIRGELNRNSSADGAIPSGSSLRTDPAHI